ncbi:unnamed protein product [Didymodactylos carnosus]|uniref:RING-type domain-containing protein n=1 Tax=Didymodactylos carnosus TaxID=1234261 RepID=A0A815PLL9_9BILA|nr:unnamed protein product [Didymodactylos carnosus]CAF1451053.1 unnamed protein product [Didymodactylos carnosus]CAF4221103.1 unnamed protein product [Didymodactylos carnosus]CAF4324440.1 unnamed protein product [Didymodactylos carnosus]
MISTFRPDSNFCTICQESLSDISGKNPLLRLSCDHEYHKKCMDNLRDSHGQYLCTLCRKVDTERQSCFGCGRKLNEEPIEQLCCDHAFHKKCLRDHWYGTFNRKCLLPNCQAVRSRSPSPQALLQAAVQSGASVSVHQHDQRIPSTQSELSELSILSDAELPPSDVEDEDENIKQMIKDLPKKLQM